MYGPADACVATASAAFAVPFAIVAATSGPTEATSAAVTAPIPSSLITVCAICAPAIPISMACAARCAVDPFVSIELTAPAI